MAITCSEYSSEVHRADSPFQKKIPALLFFAKTIPLVRTVTQTCPWATWCTTELVDWPFALRYGALVLWWCSFSCFLSPFPFPNPPVQGSQADVFLINLPAFSLCLLPVLVVQSTFSFSYVILCSFLEPETIGRSSIAWIKASEIRGVSLLLGEGCSLHCAFFLRHYDMCSFFFRHYDMSFAQSLAARRWCTSWHGVRLPK